MFTWVPIIRLLIIGNKISSPNDFNFMRFNCTRAPGKNNSDCFTYRLDNGVVFPEEIPFKFQRSLSVISAEIISLL